MLILLISLQTTNLNLHELYRRQNICWLLLSYSLPIFACLEVLRAKEREEEQ